MKVAFAAALLQGAVFVVTSLAAAPDEAKPSEGAVARAATDAKAAATPVGLQGLMPKQLPESLEKAAFESLGKDWQEWSKVTRSQLEKLYGGIDSLSLLEQTQLLDALDAQTRKLERAAFERRNAAVLGPIVELRGRLRRRVDVLRGALRLLGGDAVEEVAERLDRARRNVLQAAEALEDFLQGFIGGEGWIRYARLERVRSALRRSEEGTSGNAVEVLQAVLRHLEDRSKLATEEQRRFAEQDPFQRYRSAIRQYLEVAQTAVRQVDDRAVRRAVGELIAAMEAWEAGHGSAEAGAFRAAYEKVVSAAGLQQPLTDALRSTYFNYNFRAEITERLLNRFIEQKRVDEGPVDDVILGAKVDGTQVTESRVSADVRPSNDGARVELVLSGITRSDTQGVTDRATVYTLGNHRFEARKAIRFDGLRFHVADATIEVWPHNTTVGASTQYDGTLIGGIARRIAIREAERRRPASEAEAAIRVERRVLPPFDREANQTFAKYNKTFGDRFIPRLKRNGLFPSAYRYYSTEDEVRVRLRLMGDEELAGDVPLVPLHTDRGVRISMHETMLNNAVRRMGLEGQRISETDLFKELEKNLSDLFGRPIRLSEVQPASDEPAEFLFDTVDPIRIRIEDGEIRLIIRSGLKPAPDKETIPTQVIEVPIRIAIEGDKLVLTRGTVKVAPVEKPKSNFVQIARAGVVRKKIQDALPERKLDRSFSVKRDDGKSVTLSVSDIFAHDGWLTLTIQ
ncbi:MAG: hypothetical protein D6725_16355 [Planctomycetota bacterium]|nr:MAG: hypothetical protein D6725_16355 [Planctomycetota bacterium]